MYRVLIVDDEEPVLDSYAFMLQGAADFTLMGKARSGYEALALIHEQRPDLVFMDINIPGLDGLEVIAEVHRKFPGMIFILSTAYERFDLAQRAIPLGVFAYLVKPISKKTFLSSLDRVREHLEARTLEGETDGDTEGRFLGTAIWKALGEGAWAQYRQRLSLPSDTGVVCLLELEDGTAYQRIGEQLSHRYRCLFRMHLGRGLFFISGDLCREEAETLLAGALGLGRSWYGIGGCYRGPDLYRSSGEALEELRNQRSPRELREREQQRIIALRRGMGTVDPEALKKAFTTLWEDICALQDFTLAKAKLVSLFTLLIDDCCGSYRSNSGEPPPFAAAEEIMALEDLRAWEIWSAEAFDRLIRRAAQGRSNPVPVPLPLDKAVKYIDEHSTEGIQLIDAASAARVSPAYLSRLFSEHFKINFIDYITERRIERAEKLIRESGMNMKEIAFAVGYQDPNYFSKIFKKVLGMPPTQYAAEFRRGQEYPPEEELWEA
ncbi:helix-turn-helix domain-containing protein [Treponema sp. TIM-1]|uniref:response regulator transcription factor n=1 Tax=Treponema sp. TIM-1 TaxID=2898417 RepID=UPI0039819335